MNFLKILQNNTLLIFGVMFGFGAGASADYLANKTYKIEYISQAEILNLERERAKSLKEDSLFFGKSTDVVPYIAEFVKEKEARGARIVFATEGIVSGANVTSISKEIYAKVIEKLAEAEGREDEAR